MMKRVLAAACLLVLSACATQPQYGILPAKNPYALPCIAAQIAMANDTYAEIAFLYPAGSTTWAFRQSTPDTFGQHLVTRLKEAGYAVSEYYKDAPAPTGAVSLNYVLDNLAPSYWRVQIETGSATLSRGYVESQTSSGYTYPVGSWVEGIR